MNDDKIESVYEDGKYISRFYVNPLFRAEKIPGRNVKAGFTVTHTEADKTLIFPSISSLVDDSYPEFTGGDPAIDYGVCGLDVCDGDEDVQPVVYLDSLVESLTKNVETQYTPVCHDCYVEVRSVVEEHLSEKSEILASYLSRRI